MKTCRVCNEAHYGLGYCKKHYRQFKKYGMTKERTKKDPNIFSFKNGKVFIHMFDQCGKPSAIATVDEDDFKLVEPYKWGLRRTKRIDYAAAFVDGHMKLLHRHVLQLEKNNPHVDHINHNGLDCTKGNLRIVTMTENARNRRRGLNNKTSKYKGVHWRERDKVWIAHICKDKIKRHLGTFSNEKDAAMAYNKHAKILHGEYACLNTIE